MENDTRVKAELAAQSAGIAPNLQASTVEDVMGLARETFGDDEKARRWLARPTTALSGSRPLDALAAGPGGIQRVVDLLERIDHGLSV